MVALKEFIRRAVETKQDLFVAIRFQGAEDETSSLKSFCHAKIRKLRRDEAWSHIIYYINEAFHKGEDATESISEEVLNFLVGLGHLKLSTYWLERIYKKDKSAKEAFQTLQARGCVK